MNRKPIHVFLTLALFSSMACSNDSAESGDSAANPNGATTEQGSESEAKQDQEKFDREMPENVKRMRDNVGNETNNTLSPYRYAISSAEYSITGKLLKMSSLSKHIHGAGVTFLAPRDRAFEGSSKWKDLINEGPEAVDAFLSAYVIDQIVSYKELKETESFEAHDGSTLNVSTSGGITVNGASVSTNEIMTENGILIGMNELMP